MMYDIYWYCQMKKNEWLWKFWRKTNDDENLKKGGSREKGEEETKSMPHALVFIQGTSMQNKMWIYWKLYNSS